MCIPAVIAADGVIQLHEYPVAGFELWNLADVPARQACHGRTSVNDTVASVHTYVYVFQSTTVTGLRRQA